MPKILNLRDVASWQLPNLQPQNDSRERRRPEVLAGLPSLQRGAVWRPNQVELLWDSILRGFPIGSLVVCRLLPKELQKLRPGPVAGDNWPWPQDNYTHNLLDGQQRGNAVALGYRDPFEEPAKPKPVLWLDLDPSSAQKDQFPAASTRHHLLRLTTEAHPWGFRVSDDKEPERISSGEAFEASKWFSRVRSMLQGAPTAEGHQPSGTSDTSPQRPSPCEGWPVIANAPLPLAWALLVADQLEMDQPDITDLVYAIQLWHTVLDRIKKFQTPSRAVGADGSSDAILRTPSESIAMKPLENTSPWWEKVDHVLTKWTALPDCELKSSQALRLAQGLRRAVRTELVVLTVPQDALDAPSRLEETDATRQTDETTHENITNIEHLFARLNNGGTLISPNEMAYSMIKAYWPGIEETIGYIVKRPPETQVALLGARLARAQAGRKDASPPAFKLPAAPSVSTIRQLGMARKQPTNPQEGLSPEQLDQQVERQAWRGRMEVIFGLQPDDGESLVPEITPIANALARVDDWFGYRVQQRWGLPPVLLARMATQTSEVYLFLLWLADQSGANPMPDDDIRKQLLGLATALQWFGVDRESAVRELWKIPPNDWLDGSALNSKQWLKTLNSLKNSKQQPAPAMPFIPTPDELANYIDANTLVNNDEIKKWNWWNTLVVEATSKENQGVTDPQTLLRARDAYWNKWSGVINVLSANSYTGVNGQMLMYAQRDQMYHYFKDYDPRDTGFWDKYNVPWDFDHLLQQNAFTYKKKNHSFQKVCQQWGKTIANLHLLPFGLNRARGDEPLEKALSCWSQNDLQRSLLIDENKKSKLSSFSMDSNAMIDTDSEALTRVHTFTTEARARLLRIYRDWFDTLQLTNLV